MFNIPNSSNDFTIEVCHDPLAVSVLYHREKNLPGRAGLLEYYLRNSEQIDVLPQDKELATKIREYYTKKIVVWGLRGEKLAGFRSALVRFLADSPCTYNSEYSGLIYRIPEFYEYDIRLDKIYGEHFKDGVVLGKRNFNGILSLQPIDYLYRQTKNEKSYVYYFGAYMDECMSVVPVKLKIRYDSFGQQNNQGLAGIWNSIFTNFTPVNVLGEYNRMPGDYPSYSLRNWSLISKVSVV